MTVAAIDSDSPSVRARRTAVLDQLRRQPGLTAPQLGQAASYPRNTIAGDLKALAAKSLVTSKPTRTASGGRAVNAWFPAGGEIPLDNARLKKNRDYAAKRTYHRAQTAPGTKTLQGGACTGADPDLFFPAFAEDEAAACALCAHCPVRADCLAGAEARGERYGIWGGRNFERGKRGLPSRSAAPRTGAKTPIRTLAPLDKAARFAELRARHGTISAAGRAAGVHPATVRWYLDLLQADDLTQARVRAGRLTPSDAVQAVRRDRKARRSAP